MDRQRKEAHWVYLKPERGVEHMCVCRHDGTQEGRRLQTGAMPKARLAMHRTHLQTRRSPCSSMPSSSSYVAMLSPSLRTQSERPR